MTPQERERMNELCVEIQEEKDFHRYEELTRELSSLVAKNLKVCDLDLDCSLHVLRCALLGSTAEMLMGFAEPMIRGKELRTMW